MTSKAIDEAPAKSTRRGFLARGGTGAVAAAAVLGGVRSVAAQTAPAAAGSAPAAAAENLPPHAAEWTRSLGEPTAKAYGMPSKFEKAAVRSLYPGLKEPMSAYSTTPLQELDGIITPNGLHYERHHAGVPQIDPAEHRLMIHGLTERDMLFTMEDIRQFPSESKIYFLECSGNPSFLPPYGKTAGEVVGLLSCAQWTGVPCARC